MDPVPPVAHSPVSGGDAAAGSFTAVAAKGTMPHDTDLGALPTAPAPDGSSRREEQQSDLVSSHLDQAQKEALLERALEEVSRLHARAARSDEEKRQCLETTRNLKGLVQIMGRVRPALEGEDDIDCLRVLSKTQLEVLTEPRALLTEQHMRNRRKTTGGIGHSPQSKSLSALSEENDSQVVSKAPLEPRLFVFDQLFDADTSDDDVFAALHDELIATLDGEAVCILAYGATGSGKTHTVVNLAMRAALELERQAVALAQGGIRLEITVQIVEIYNEQLRDLLAQDGNAEPPRLKLSVSSSSTNLQGATLRTVALGSGKGIARGLQEALRIGQAQRATSSTAVHGRSSRSHLVMTLFLSLHDAYTGTLRQRGKLSLVDLAGSERIKRSEAVGDRLREAQFINRSLSALADVISAKERKAFVPYRNSKLTHLLQDALGGQQQCRTVVIVALPPTRYNLNDTLHSLQFSSRLTALSLPSISRKTLCTFEQGRFGSGSSQRSRNELQNADLRSEAERLKSENEKLRNTMFDFRKQIDEKDKKLEEAQQENADLRSSSELFERSREKLFLGFEALHRCLENVEATTFLDDSDATALQDAMDLQGSSLWDPAMEVEPLRSSSRLQFQEGSSMGSLQEAGTPPQETNRVASASPRFTSRSGSGGLQQPKRIQPVLRPSRSAGPESGPMLPRRSASPPKSVRIASAGTSTASTAPAYNQQPPSTDYRFNSSEADQRRGHPSGGTQTRSSASSSRPSRIPSPELGRRQLHGGTESSRDGRHPSPDLPSRSIRGAGGGAESSTSRNVSPDLSSRPLRQTSKDAQREVPTPARSQASSFPSERRTGNSANVPPNSPRRTRQGSPPAVTSQQHAAASQQKRHQPARSKSPTDNLRSPGRAALPRTLAAVDGAASMPVPSGSETERRRPHRDPEHSGPTHFEMYSPPRENVQPPAWYSPPRIQDAENSQPYADPVVSPSKPAWLNSANVVGVYKPPPVPVMPMSPRAPNLLDSLAESIRGSPGVPDEASGPVTQSGRATSSARSPRAGSAPRRTPRDYVVEVLSPARARELSSDVHLDREAERAVLESSQRCNLDPQSPALLLCPESHGDSTASLNRSCSSVSISSDECEIRDRLKQSLMLRAMSTGTCEEANSPPSARRSPGRNAPGSAERRGGASPPRSARVATSPSGRRHPQSYSQPPLSSRHKVSTSSSPTRHGGRTAGNSAVIPAAGSPNMRVGWGGSNPRRGAPSQPATSQSGGITWMGSGGSQRQYIPVLSRRSLGDLKPIRR